MTETVVVTASADALPGLTKALRAIPVAVEEHPLVSFSPPVDWAPLDDALERLNSYGALAFTSPRAADSVLKRFRRRLLSWHPERSLPIVWASGPATAAALDGALGAVRTPADVASARWGAAGALARAMLDEGVVSPVLFPCGEIHRDELPEQLRSRGLQVDEIVCYRSVLAGQATARAAASRGTVLVVTSPRVAELLAGACSSQPRPDLVAVGPTTAASARGAGWSPAAVASLPGAEAVTSAVRSVLARRAHE
jgi:uroporphyrinogen-III synthase